MNVNQSNYRLNKQIQRVIATNLPMRWQRRPGSAIVDLVSCFSKETGEIRTHVLFSTYRLDTAQIVTELVRQAGGVIDNEPEPVFNPPDPNYLPRWWRI